MKIRLYRLAMAVTYAYLALSFLICIKLSIWQIIVGMLLSILPLVALCFDSEKKKEEINRAIAMALIVIVVLGYILIKTVIQ